MTTLNARCTQKIECNWAADLQNEQETLCEAAKILIYNFRVLTVFTILALLGFIFIVVKIHKSDEAPKRKKAKLLIGYLALIS
jgi:hypothetical protein